MPTLSAGKVSIRRGIWCSRKTFRWLKACNVDGPHRDSQEVCSRPLWIFQLPIFTAGSQTDTARLKPDSLASDSIPRFQVSGFRFQVLERAAHPISTASSDTGACFQK